MLRADHSPRLSRWSVVQREQFWIYRVYQLQYPKTARGDWSSELLMRHPARPRRRASPAVVDVGGYLTSATRDG